MFRQAVARRSRLFAVSVVITLSACVGFVGNAPQLSAAEPLKDKTALKFVPADVAYYATSMRNKEWLDSVLNSRAVAKLMELPAVALVKGLIEGQWTAAPGPIGQFKEVFEQDENQELLGLLGDMVSNETFVYGDDRFAVLLPIINQISGAFNMGKMKAQLQKLQGDEEQDGDGDTEKEATLSAIRDVLKSLEEQGDALHFPNVVFGFKLTNTKPAKSQMSRLEGLAKEVLSDNPELSKRFKRVKVDGGDFLELDLDGELVPWAMIPWEAVQEEEGQYDKLVEKLKTLTLTVCLGVRDDYLLLFIGESSAYLKVAKTAKLLHDRAELTPLRKLGDKPFTKIGYVSQAYREKLQAANAPLEGLAKVIETLLPFVPAELELKDDLEADVADLRKAASEMTHEAGAKLSFAFNTPKGYEGFAYDYSSNYTLDGSQKLTLLEHVAGQPLAFYVARGKYQPEQYTAVSEAIARVFAQGEKVALHYLPEDQQAEYQKYREMFLPLIERLDKATSELLIPALKDGQTGLVLDGRSTSKHWCKDMPESDKPLPMLELALVFGVSDAKLLGQAFDEYAAIIKETAEKLHEAAPEQIPEIEIPAPESAQAKGGTIYFYPFPEEWGIDEKLSPNAAMSAKVAVLSTSRGLTEKLLAKQPLQGGVCPLAAGDKPLASAAYFNWRGFVDAATPWIDYAVAQAMSPGSADDDSSEEDGAEKASGKDDDDEKEEKEVDQKKEDDEKEDDDEGGEMEEKSADDDDPGVKMIMDQVHVVLDILKCYGGGSSVSYFEGKTFVTHYEGIWGDLPDPNAKKVKPAPLETTPKKEVKPTPAEAPAKKSATTPPSSAPATKPKTAPQPPAAQPKKDAKPKAK